MFGQITRSLPTELKVEGYIRQNYLNTKRLIHISGHGNFKIKRIELADDPCPLKISHDHKEKMLNSQAASRVTSRRSSRAGSFDQNGQPISTKRII